MSVNFKKSIAMFAAAIMVAAFSGSTLSLAKDGRIEQRLRPGSGWGNYESGPRASAHRSHAPQRATETRQSFSYEPAEGVAKTDGGCHQHAVAAPAAPKEDVATTPQTVRRSFSYEPSVQPEPRTRTYKRVAPKKDRWLIPKADPRRYRH